ncbi:glycoside hydrolase family 88 protein [Cerasicoccus arenae]|uniref:Glycosyl hydrolase family 88 n=1 Tax=Cerasicoccus arenae TaxID=424488 RepID=A0A8J3GD14_9BACT|nr:glycoside hydrolase family 88 protein [Cerasicoccus arenae]MBK1857115.1 glycoside hydrolase family 88 protein [Cerasicoccus arenae]GHB92453.1 hypothetical protein GCM10007047_04470 [Cerasicoccus arenae]
MNPKNCPPLDLALAIARRHEAIYQNFDHYTGIVTMHGMARLATESRSPETVEAAKATLKPYIAGERHWNGNFPNYFCGGNATAWMLHKSMAPEAADTVRFYAEQIMNDAPRNPEGILEMIHGDRGRIWIDVAFAVTPFMVFAGLALDNEDYVEEGFQQTAMMVKAFRNDETGLLHQSRGFCGPDKLSEDHWSRGNGWGAYALCELAVELPDAHPRKAEAVAMFRDLINSVLSFQEDSGLWRQEMTARSRYAAYLETSGSALILYAMGRGLVAGISEEVWREKFQLGLRGLLEYITPDLDIFHTCAGCLSPRKGTKLDYMAVAPVKNDHHAFGPYVLAFGQAAQLGYTSTQDL